MNNDRINNNQQAQEKPSRKVQAAKWLWRLIRFMDIACRWIDKIEGGE